MVLHDGDMDDADATNPPSHPTDSATPPLCDVDAPPDDSAGFRDTHSVPADNPPTQRRVLCNAALRQNFEHLKSLYMKLSQVNVHLRETCKKRQTEKAQLQGGNWPYENRYGKVPEDHPAMLLDKGNDCLRKEMEAVCFERDQAIKEKEAIEEEYAKLLSLTEEENIFRHKAGELAHKCKYLEMDLETACVAGEAAHEQLLKVTYEKDTRIFDLEKSKQQLEENVRKLEEEREAGYKTWNKERNEFMKMVDDIGRERTNYKEMCTSLENQISDLRAMLTAMEQTTQDAELSHMESMELVQKDNNLLEEDLVNVKKDWKSAKESVLQLQKEIVELRAESSGLRTQLQAALSDAHTHQQNSLQYMHINEQLQESLAAAQENIASLIELRKDDEHVYWQRLMDYQANWELDRERLLSEKNSYIEDRITKILKQNHILKKRLKQSYKVLAMITCDYNLLKSHALELRAKSHLFPKVHGKACDEIEMKSSISKDLNIKENLTAQSPKRHENYLDIDMANLAKRQMKILDLLAST